MIASAHHVTFKYVISFKHITVKENDTILQNKHIRKVRFESLSHCVIASFFARF